MTRLLALALSGVLTLTACTGGTADPPARGPATGVATPEAATSGTLQATGRTDGALPVVTVYKSPTCGCCMGWIEHLREHGFPVEIVDVGGIGALKDEYGIPPELQSCHTGVVEGYIVEGHVPADDVKRLLAGRPDAGGLAVPGMPIGSPGMEQGDTRQPYDVLLVNDGGTTVFARH